MYNACVTRNREGNLPHDVARLAGHKDLAQALKTFSSYIAQGKVVCFIFTIGLFCLGLHHISTNLGLMIIKHLKISFQ